MNNMPYVSIIIITYNGSEYITSCLNSLLNQDYLRSRYEIIIGDNGSKDNTVEILKTGFGNDTSIIEFKQNYGFAKANNSAIKYTKGELVVFLNQDVIVHKKWLSGLVSGIENENLDACCSNLIMPRNQAFDKMNTDKFPSKIHYYTINNRYGYIEQKIEPWQEEMIPVNFLTGASFIIKRSIIEKLGYIFDGRLKAYNEDLDMSLNLTNNNYRIGMMPNSVVYHITNFSFKINRFNIWKNYIITRNRYIVYWKYSTISGFIRKLHILVFSQSHKVYMRCNDLRYNRIKSIFLSLAVIPFSFITLVVSFKGIFKLKYTSEYSGRVMANIDTPILKKCRQSLSR